LNREIPRKSAGQAPNDAKKGATLNIEPRGAWQASNLSRLGGTLNIRLRQGYGGQVEHRMMLCAIVLTFLTGTAGTFAAPGYGEPLSITTGTVYSISTLTELKNAVNSANGAGVPATILIADGTYVLDIPLLHIMCDNLIIRSASGNRDAVIIKGPDEGPSATATHIFLVPASYVTIADITLGYCRYHGIQVQGESPNDAAGLWVHNCHIINCNEQFIKGSSADADPVGATDGIIENCLFEFSSGFGYQYYTGGIDIHKGVNWIVRDNIFRNLRNPNDDGNFAEHAVHFWKRCPTFPQNVVVERNWIINCDRGIGFGLGTEEVTGHNGGASAIRNNFVYSDDTGMNTDVCIGLEHASGVKVDNNTVYNAVYGSPIEYRFSTSSNLFFRNNLVNHAIRNRDGAPAPVMSDNLESVQASWFRDLAQGDLHILPGVSSVIDQGGIVSDFSDDLDGDSRPKLGGWDIGADEYDPATADSEGDGMTDSWETTYGLEPLIDDALDDKDGDAMDNLSEYISGTNPSDVSNYFSVVSMSKAGEGVMFQWQGAGSRKYSVASAARLPGPFTNEPLFSDVPGLAGVMSFTSPIPALAQAFYRVKVELE
jgi:hypothetical protein